MHQDRSLSLADGNDELAELQDPSPDLASTYILAYTISSGTPSSCKAETTKAGEEKVPGKRAGTLGTDGKGWGVDLAAGGVANGKSRYLAGEPNS